MIYQNIAFENQYNQQYLGFNTRNVRRIATRLSEKSAMKLVLVSPKSLKTLGFVIVTFGVTCILLYMEYLNIPKQYQSDDTSIMKISSADVRPSQRNYFSEKEELVFKKQSTPRRVVLILTHYRSGSSFFGELFNQHDDAFYVFEPLIPLTDHTKCTNQGLIRQVIKNITQCEFPDWKYMYKNKVVKNPVRYERNIAQCLHNNYCFRGNTRDLCTPKYCNRSTTVQQYACFNVCPVANLTEVSKDCLSKSVLAIKFIRVCDIYLVRDALMQQGIDTKVIQLIRDPRGIQRSRSAIGKVNITISLGETCSRQYKNYKVANYMPPDWLEGKYKVMRYEDVALYPYEKAKEVYEFAGLPFTQKVKDWIRDNTQKISPELIQKVKSRDLIDGTMKHIDYLISINAKEQLGHYMATLNPDLFEIAKEYKNLAYKRVVNGKRFKNAFATTRDSENIVEKWKKTAPHRNVKEVERVCVDIMRKMNYTMVGNQTTYQNKSISYIGTFNPTKK